MLLVRECSLLFVQTEGAFTSSSFTASNYTRLLAPCFSQQTAPSSFARKTIVLFLILIVKQSPRLQLENSIPVWKGYCVLVNIIHIHMYYVLMHCKILPNSIPSGFSSCKKIQCTYKINKCMHVFFSVIQWGYYHKLVNRKC